MLIVCDFVYLFWSKESASFTHWNAKETTPFCSRNLASLAKIACRVKGEPHYNQRHQQLFNGHLHQTYQSRLSNKSECVNCLQWKAKIGLGLDNDRFILYWKIWSSQCTYLWSFNAYKFFCPTFAVWWNIASLSLSKLLVQWNLSNIKAVYDLHILFIAFAHFLPIWGNIIIHSSRTNWGFFFSEDRKK